MMMIEELGLSVRVYHIMKRSKIDTVEQLAGLYRNSRPELMRVRCFGIKAMEEASQKLKEKGYTDE